MFKLQVWNVLLISVLCAFAAAAPGPCPRKPCLLIGCPYGLVTDDDGCTVCECENPCGLGTDQPYCPSDELCIVTQPYCFRVPCPPRATCVRKSEVCGGGDDDIDDVRVCGSAHRDRAPCRISESCTFHKRSSLDGICCENNPTSCADERADALKKMESFMLGVFLPECTDDGFYAGLQCHASAGSCWCSDRHGNEIEGTRGGPGSELPECE